MSKNILTKEKSLINAIILSTNRSFSLSKIVLLTQKIFKKRKISLSNENIEKLVFSVIEEFKNTGIIDGDNKSGYCLTFNNHFSNKDFENNIEDLYNRNLQM